jgi:hypothetical protein
MPRARRAPGKRPRTWKDKWLVLPPPTLDELIREMEKPLSEAIGFTGALKLMGEGLAERGDEGCAVLAVSEAVQERLQSVQDAWLGLVQGAPSPTRRGRS